MNTPTTPPTYLDEKLTADNFRQLGGYWSAQLAERNRTLILTVCNDALALCQSAPEIAKVTPKPELTAANFPQFGGFWIARLAKRDRTLILAICNDALAFCQRREEIDTALRSNLVPCVITSRGRCRR